MSTLQGKVAIITGGSRGIGRAICFKLAEAGAKVVVNYASNDAMAEEVVQKIGKDQALAVKADAASVAEMERLVSETVQKFGKIDIVVAAAGIMKLTELDSLTEEEFDRHMAVNVKGPLFLTQKAVPHMTSGGRVILFSTTQTIASTVTPNYLAYCTTKGAINQMTRLLSKQLAPKGIMVNTVSPGPTATDLFLEGKSEQLLNMIKNFNPQKKFGTPEQIADVTLLLSSAGAEWISGQVIPVNGGTA